MGGWASKKQDEDLEYSSLPIRPLIIEAETWKRDSHGLYDYETRDIIRNNLKIIGSTQLFRKEEGIEQTFHPIDHRRKADIVLDISFGSDNNAVKHKEEREEDKKSWDMSDNEISKNDETSPIAQIIYKFGQYWIYNKPSYNLDDDFNGDPQKYIWYTIRDYQESASSWGYIIKENDILKFGRARVKVIKISNKNAERNSECHLKVTDKFEKWKLNSIELPNAEVDCEGDTEAPTWRICFMEAESSNPLTSICKCSGSMKYIHQCCLRGWIDSK